MQQYEVRTARLGSYECTELVELGSDSKVSICPQRGGIAIGCRLSGQELFYLDEATFLDPSANIRGGNPILFPICGPLEGGQYEWEGRSYAMKQHGFARNLAWETAETSADGQASVTLLLRSNADTRAVYPFDFELAFTYVLKESVLHIRQEYRNIGERAMPLYAGFHPYFAAADRPIRYQTDGTKLFDVNDGQEKPVTDVFEADRMVESVIILDARQPTVSFQPNGTYTVTLDYSPVFRYLVLWSVPGKPFVCVEPWMARPFEMNRRQELQLVQPQDTLHAAMSIRIGD